MLQKLVCDDCDLSTNVIWCSTLCYSYIKKPNVLLLAVGFITFAECIFIITPLLCLSFPSLKKASSVFNLFIPCHEALIFRSFPVSEKLKIQSRRSIGIDSHASITFPMNVDHWDKLTRNSIRCSRRKNRWNSYNLNLSCLWHLHDVQRKILLEFGSQICSSCRISFVNGALQMYTTS